MEIGSDGLAEVNLTIPQSTSLTFDIIHKDEDGNVIDHSSSTARMAIQTKDRSHTLVLDECCECGSERIRVTITPEISRSLPIGKMPWDMIVEMVGGEQPRLCYGTARIIDTYAEDEEQE